MREPLPSEFAHALAARRDRLGRLASRLVYFSSIGSTNDEAARLAAAGGEGAVIVAETQTAGRGRLGRTWFSPPGNGLYVSVVLEPGRAGVAAARATSLLTLAAGVALAEAIESVVGLRADVKWPNDLYVGRRKLAGILAEAIAPAGPAPTSGAPAVVLGYGINVAGLAYPPELSDRATSLETELGRPVDRGQLFAATLVALAARYDDLMAARFDAILDAWRDRAPASCGARVRFTTAAGSVAGITCGVDHRGALLVRVGARVEAVVAGVTWE